MHYPQTVAHEIKYPWFHYKPWPKKDRRDPNPYRLRRHWEEMSEFMKKTRDRHWPEGYRETFITIWHVDPEKDGSDNSCGFGYVHLSKKTVEILRNASWAEGHNPHFLCCAEKSWDGTITEAESLYVGLVFLVARVLRLPMTYDQASKYASEAIHIRDCGKFGDTFCFLPGYHTNSEKDSKEQREQHFQGILCGVARTILTDRRPWWKHPKWHFWHWKIQCHPLLLFKRWAFSRCCKCGKGFKWGYSPATNNWNSKGPRWFRSETDTFHSDCDSPLRECQEESSQAN